VTDELSNQKNRPKKRSEMSDKERVRDFQRKLYLKAKQEKNYRFYILYDKICLPHVLREAYAECRKKGERPGIDGVTYEQIEREGKDEYLKGIKQELEEGTYRPLPVERTYIPKANGKMRPLGIPIIKDRIIQKACKMIIEPIFEADFEESSYGFRPKRSAHDAVKEIKAELREGKTEVYDADLSSYFDTIPHKELMYLVGLRICDKRVLRLIKMWLKAPIYEDGKYSGGKKNKKGTPQGGVISPLLANIYLHLLDKAVKRNGGVFQKAGIHIVRYADDFILMGKKIKKEAIKYLYGMMERMKLKINEEKSRLINAKMEPFNFLGFTVRYDNDIHGRGKRYWNIVPSKKAEQRVKDKIKEFCKKHGHASREGVVSGLNSIIRGWVRYFSIPKTSYPAVAKRRLRYYMITKLYRYYRRKSQRKCKLYNQGAFGILVKRYGLLDPTKLCFL